MPQDGYLFYSNDILPDQEITREHVLRAQRLMLDDMRRQDQQAAQRDWVTAPNSALFAIVDKFMESVEELGTSATATQARMQASREYLRKQHSLKKGSWWKWKRKLDVCPSCESSDVVCETIEDATYSSEISGAPDIRGEGYYVLCIDCENITEVHEQKSVAIKEWNER